MGVFDSLNNTTDKATNIGERYLKASREYLKLKIFHQLTLSMSLMVKVVLIGGMFSIGMIFTSVALAIHLGKVFENMALGFLAVGALYISLAVLLYMLRTKINKVIIKKTGQNFFK